MIFELINLFCSFIEAFMITRILKTRFENKRTNIWLEIILLLLMDICWGLLNDLAQAPLGFLLGNALMIFYAHYMLEGKLSSKIITLFFSLLLLLLSDYSFMLFMDFIHITGEESISIVMLQSPQIRSIVTIISKILFIVLTLSYIQWYKTRTQKPLPINKTIIILSIFCLLALILINKSTEITLYGDSRTNQTLLFFSILIVLFYILVVGLLSYLYQSNQASYQYQSLIQKDKLQRQHDEEMRLLEADLEAWKTDSLEKLTQLQEQIHKQQYDNLADCWKSLEEDIYQHEYILTGNETLDIILNQKLAIAKEKGIQIHYNIQQVEWKHIQTIDVISLMSNLLDNAIEATAPTQQKEPKIYLQIQKNNQYITIKTENPYHVIRTNSHGRLLTTKKDEKWHGRGISSMQSIAKRYHGTLHYESKEDDFTIWIVLADEPETSQQRKEIIS